MHSSHTTVGVEKALVERHHSCSHSLIMTGKRPFRGFPLATLLILALLPPVSSSCITVLFYSIGRTVTEPMRPPYVDCINDPTGLETGKTQDWRLKQQERANSVGETFTIVGQVLDVGLILGALYVGASEGSGGLIAGALFYSVLVEGQPDWEQPELDSGPSWVFSPEAPGSGQYRYDLQSGCSAKNRYEYITLNMGSVPEPLLTEDPDLMTEECDRRYREAAVHRAGRMDKEFQADRIHEVASGCFFEKENTCYCRLSFGPDTKDENSTKRQ